MAAGRGVGADADADAGVGVDGILVRLGELTGRSLVPAPCIDGHGW